MGKPRSPKGRAQEVHRRLALEYPGADCELTHANAFQLLAATILSAQTTDVRVNMVTPALFAAFPDAESLANADIEQVEQIIKELQRHRFGRRAETLPEDQLLLGLEEVGRQSLPDAPSVLRSVCG